MRSVLIGVSLAAMLGLGSGATAQQTSSFFDVFADYAFGPPYPTPMVGVHVMNGSPGALHHDADFRMGLGSMRLNGLPPGTPVNGAVSVQNGAPGPGGYSIDSFFDIFTDLSVAPPGPQVTGFFDVFTELSAVGSPGVVLRAVPVGQPYLIDSFFDIWVDVELPTQGGTMQRLRLQGEMAPGVHLLPSSSVEFPPNSFFDIFFEVSFDMQTYNPANPAMRISLTGSVPGPGAAGLLGFGLVVALRRRR